MIKNIGYFLDGLPIFHNLDQTELQKENKFLIFQVNIPSLQLDFHSFALERKNMKSLNIISQGKSLLFEEK